VKRVMFWLLFTMILSFLFSPCRVRGAQAESLPAALDAMAKRLMAEIGDSEKQRVAVADFCGLDGEVTRVGLFVSEELTTRLVRMKQVSVVERKQLQKVIGELKWQTSGVRDIDSAQKLGKFVGADVIVIGTVAELKTTLKINARAIDIDTGTVMAAEASLIDRTPDIDLLLSKTEVESPAPRPTKKATPAYRKGNYIVNGDFRDRQSGWHRSIGDITSGASQVDFITIPHLKSGRALYVRHKGRGHIQFHQTADVPGPELVFSISFQAQSHEGMIKGFSGSGVSQIGLKYMDENGNGLGETILLNYVKNPFADTPLIGVPRRKDDSYKTHFVEFTSGRFHQDYRIDIRREIENNLLGMDPEAVRRIAVILWCGANHTQAGSELWVADVSLTAR
jgi:TolB-like protein